MKVFNKWLVMGKVGDNVRLAHPGFKTKNDAIYALNNAGFKRLSDNSWEDSFGQQFYITKNTKEYK